jgi:branched-chain amino acid transport system substrate-binding protein
VNKHRGIMLGLTILFAIVFTVGIFGCNTQAPVANNQPPVEKKPLKIGFSIPMTGPAAEKGAPIGQGELDAVKYINDELGGVDGYKLEAVWYDTAYDAAKAATIVKKLMDDGCIFFTVVASKDMAASKEIADRAGFPGMVCFSSPALTHPPKHIYAQLPDYGDDWAAFARYYMENIWKGPGKPKMALELLNNPTGYGVRDAARAAAETMGIEIVATEEHAATTVSEIDAITRIKAKNPDVLFISSTPAPTAIILKNAYEKQLIPGITVGCAHASYTKALVDLAGKDICEGVYGVYPTVAWGDNVPGMAKMVEYCQTRHPEYVGNADYLIGWASSLINAEIVRQAIKNSGYESLSKADAASWQVVELKGVQKVQGYDVGGLTGPVDFSDPVDKRGSKSVKIFQVKNGVITAITGWVDAPLIKYEDFSWFGK